MKSRYRLKLLFLFVLSFNLQACSLSGDYDSNSDPDIRFTQLESKDQVIDKGPVKGGTLRLFSTTPDTLNPIITENIYVQDLSRLIFESLVRLDKAQKPQPLLSDKWSVSEDGLTWIFHIREGVLWHDNIPLSSEDVEFTLETILKSNTGSAYKKILNNITTFSALDRSNFQIILKSPYSFLPELMTFPILPKHSFVNQNPTKPDSTANMKPVGTGPYKFVSYNEKKLIKLMINDNWWSSKMDGEKASVPYIAEVEVKVYPTIDDSISAFQAKDVDAVFIGNNECNKYIGRSDMVIKKYSDKNYDFIAFNLGNPVLSDISVRQAIAYSIDKAKIIKEVIAGEAVAADLPILPDSWLNNSNPAYYAPDISKARGILLNSGWKDSEGTFYKRIKGVMKQLDLEILVNEENEVRIKIAENIVKQLKESGIKSNVKKVSWDESMKRIKSRKFDLVLTGCRISSIPDISFLYSSAEAASGLNIAGYSNKTVDSYLSQILSENDSNTKRAMFINMTNTIFDDLPYIGLYFYNNAGLFNKRIRGDISPDIWGKYNDITNWYIPNN